MSCILFLQIRHKCLNKCTSLSDLNVWIPYELADSVAEELAICWSGVAVVGVTTVVLIGDNKDILTRTRAVGGDDWTSILHTLAHIRHFLFLIALLNLSVDLLLGLGCQLSSADIVKLSFLKCNKLLSFFNWVVT